MIESRVCRSCEKPKPLADFPKKKSCADGYNTQCKLCHNAQQRENYKLTKTKDQQYLRHLLRSKPAYKMASRAKDRARKLGLPFTIDWRQLVVPSECPILGIPLRVGEGIFSDNSPSLDRIKPELGYIEGNVIIISYRANRLKNNGTADELLSIGNWLKQHDL